MCLMFTLWGASPLGVISNASPLGVISNVSPLGVISNVSPLGVPADLQSADKKARPLYRGFVIPSRSLFISPSS